MHQLIATDKFVAASFLWEIMSLTKSLDWRQKPRIKQRASSRFNALPKCFQADELDASQ